MIMIFRKLQIHILVALAFVLAIAGLALTGTLFMDAQRARIERLSTDEITALATIKAARIADWRQERLTDAETVMAAAVGTPGAAQTMKTGRNPERKKLFLKWVHGINAHAPYTNIFFIAPKKFPLAALNGSTEPLTGQHIQIIDRAVGGDHIVLSDLFTSTATRRPAMAMAVPLTTTKGGATILIGSLLFTIDPEDFLFPALRSGDDSTRTTTLVSRDGDRASFLRIAGADDSTSPAGPLWQAMASSATIGQESSPPDMTSLQQVPDTPWSVIVTADRRARLASLTGPAYRAAAAAGTLLLGIGALLLVLWHKQTSSLTRHLQEAESQRQATARHCEEVIRFSEQAIFLLNDRMSILEANDAATTLYGYAAEELRAMHLNGLCSLDGLQALPRQLDTLSQNGELSFPSSHRKKDGAVFSVIMRMRRITIDTHQFYQAVIVPNVTPPATPLL